jgi:hypothetical protein
MKDWFMSFLIWILLPSLLILTDLFIGANILVLILLFTWLGFGALIYAPPEEE